MAKPSLASRATPVAVPNTPAELCETWQNLKAEEKRIENNLETLKPLMMQIAPSIPQTSVEIPGVFREKKGIFVVYHGSQDRRTPDDELLMNLLGEKGLINEGCSPRPNHDKIAALIEVGKITTDELAACLSGSVTHFPQITKFKEL